MIFNITILLLLLVTIFLILKKNKLFLISLIMIIIVSILSKNTKENFSSLDILYPSHSLQTINRQHMLNNFKNPNTPNIIYTDTIQEEGGNCINIFNTDIIKTTNNYILVKEIDGEYYLLNGYIYDINNSELYLEKLNKKNLKMNLNYGLQLQSSRVNSSSYGFNILVKPYNSKYNSNIPGYVQGQNNGNVIINPIQGNLNNIFYFENCSNDIKGSLDSDLDILDNNNLLNVYECNIFCNNRLYLDVSTIGKTLYNKKKIILKKKISNNNNWLLFVYNSTNSNINDLYFNFRSFN